MTPRGNHTDADLVRDLNHGDEGAFAEIYRRYVRDLFNYARRNIPAKEDCEEIIQEIFESLWSRRSSLRIDTSLRGYLLGMVRYKIVSYFRKSTLKKKYAEHFLLFEAVYEQPEGEAMEHVTIPSGLDKLISKLPDRCQQAVKLRLSENLSNHEIAKRMNIATRTVETYMFRAFNYIRTYYKDMGI